MNEQLAAIRARREAVTPGVVPGPVYSQTKADATDKAHWILMRDELAAANADIDTLLAHVAAAERAAMEFAPAWYLDAVQTMQAQHAAHVAALTAERDALAQQLQQAQRELAAVPVDAIRKMRFDAEVELHGYTNAELDEWLDAEQDTANAAAELRAPTYGGGCW